MTNLEFTDQEMMIINSALVEMPYRVVAPLIKNINEQLAQQQDKEKK